MTFESRTLSRREVMALLGGAVVTITTLTACGGSSSPSSPSSGGGTSGDKNGAISGNHGHTATIFSAQLTAGGALNDLDIRGGATHSHLISLSANDVVSIRGGTRVSTTSTSGDGHTHQVTFN